MAQPRRVSFKDGGEDNSRNKDKEEDVTGVKKDLELVSGLDRLQSVNAADFEDYRTKDRQNQGKIENSVFPALGAG